MISRASALLLVLACGCAETLEEFHDRCGFDEWVDKPAPGVNRRIVRAVSPTARYARRGPDALSYVSPAYDEDAVARTFHEAKPARFDRFEGTAICEVAPAHPETLDPYHVNLLVFQLNGRTAPDLVAKGRMGSTNVSWGPQTRDVAYFVQRVTLAQSDAIDLSVGDEDLHEIEPIGRVVGAYHGASPIVLEDKNVRVTCKLWTADVWESLRRSALAKLEADATRIRSYPTDETWLSDELIKDVRAHMVLYDVYGARDDADQKRAAAAIQDAADAWWRKRMREVDAHQGALSSTTEWIDVDRDFAARSPGVACYTGEPVLPHCESVVELRARHGGVSACGILGDKIASLKMTGVTEDGVMTYFVKSSVFRGGHAIASLHELDDLRQGEVISIDLYHSGADGYDKRDKLDLTTADAIPWRLRAIRVGDHEIRIY